MSNDQPTSQGGGQQYGTNAAQNGSGLPNMQGWDTAVRQAAEAAHRFAQEQADKNK